MRRLVALAMLATLALGIAGTSNAANPQVVNGSILSPTRHTSGGGFPGLGRRVWVTAAYAGVEGSTNGVISYIFAVDPETVGGDFTIDNVSDATGAADLDIYFYDDLGDDVVGETPPTTSEGGEYQTLAAGGETGSIPLTAKYAIVFTANGVNSSFTYTGSL